MLTMETLKFEISIKRSSN